MPTDTAESPPPISWLAMASIWIVSLIVYHFLRFESVSLLSDTVVYIAGARSLAAGDGYTLAWHVGLPRIVLYPPGNSLWLSLFWPAGMTFESALPRLSWAMSIAAALANSMLFLLCERTRLPRAWSFGLVAVWAVSPLWVQWVFWMMSDIAFMAIVVGLMAWAVDLTRVPSRSEWLFVGMIVALALMFRSAAIAIFVGVGLVGWRVSRNDPVRVFLGLLPGALYLGSWQIWARHGMGYAGNYSEFLRNSGGIGGYIEAKAIEAVYWASGFLFFEALFPLVSRTGEFLLNRQLLAAGFAARAVGFLAFGITVWLVWRGLRVRVTPGLKAIGTVLALYAALVFAAPNQWWFAHRYLYPLWVLMAVYACHALSDFAGRAKRPLQFRRLAALAACIVIAFNLVAAIRTRNFWCQPEVLREAKEIATRLDQEKPKRILVAADVNQFPLMYLGDHLGEAILANYFAPPMNGSPIPLRIEDQKFARPDFVILPGDPPPAIPAAVLHHEMVTRAGRWHLYRVDPDGDAAWRRSVGMPPAP